MYFVQQSSCGWNQQYYSKVCLGECSGHLRAMAASSGWCSWSSEGHLWLLVLPLEALPCSSWMIFICMMVCERWCFESYHSLKLLIWRFVIGFLPEQCPACHRRWGHWRRWCCSEFSPVRNRDELDARSCGLGARASKQPAGSGGQLPFWEWLSSDTMQTAASLPNS